MKKIIKNKNIYHKCVHNLKSKILHVNGYKNHILSRDWARVFDDLSPIYAELDIDYSRVDLIDFLNYERWLNG